jgi:hypothetical protein
MFACRRWLAAFLVVVFSAVEVFAAAPQLHFHPQSEALANVPASGKVVTAQRDRTPKANDCIACRTLSLATTLISWLGVTPPAEHQTAALAAPTAGIASGILDDARGRAPPAC